MAKKLSLFLLFLFLSTYYKRRNFRSFRKIEKNAKLISIPNFLPPGLQTFRLSLLVFFSFSPSESTKLSSIRKVLDGKVRNFSPTKISSFPVFHNKCIEKIFNSFSAESSETIFSTKQKKGNRKKKSKNACIDVCLPMETFCQEVEVLANCVYQAVEDWLDGFGLVHGCPWKGGGHESEWTMRQLHLLRQQEKSMATGPKLGLVTRSLDVQLHSDWQDTINPHRSCEIDWEYLATSTRTSVSRTCTGEDLVGANQDLGTKRRWSVLFEPRPRGCTSICHGNMWRAAGPGPGSAAPRALSCCSMKTSNSKSVREVPIKFAFDSLHRLERKIRSSAQLCLLYGVLTTLWHCVITDINWNVVSPFRPRHRSSLSCQATDQAVWSWCCGRCAYRINRTARRCQLDKSFWARKQVQNGKMCDAKVTLCGACWCNFQIVPCAMPQFFLMLSNPGNLVLKLINSVNWRFWHFISY